MSKQIILSTVITVIYRFDDLLPNFLEPGVISNSQAIHFFLTIVDYCRIAFFFCLSQPTVCCVHPSSDIYPVEHIYHRTVFVKNHHRSALQWKHARKDLTKP